MLSHRRSRRCASAHCVVEIYSSASGFFQSYPTFEPDGAVGLPDRMDVEALPLRIDIEAG
jgi:hypothetical protein